MRPDDETSRLAAMPDLLRIGNRERRVADNRLNQLGKVELPQLVRTVQKAPM